MTVDKSLDVFTLHISHIGHALNDTTRLKVGKKGGMDGSEHHRNFYGHLNDSTLGKVGGGGVVDEYIAMQSTAFFPWVGNVYSAVLSVVDNSQ